MAVKFTNNAATTLAAGINNSVTSIAVTDGSVFPTITGSDYFYVTFDDGTNKEIVKVTARSSNTLTVVRGHDNTSARAFSSGDKAELRVVAALLADVIAGVGSSALNVDTFSGNGSATAFTLSTTPAGEDNLIVFIEGVYQNPADFTLSGTTLTFDVAPANSRNIIVYHVAALVSGNNLTHNQFTCNGSTTAFTLSLAPIHENNTQVFLNGVYQHKNTYAVSGTTLTLDTAPTNGVILEVMSFTQTDVNTLPAAFVSGLTQVTAVGADHFMIFDATDSALKKSLVSDVLESATSISTSADATAITIDSSENVTFTAAVTTGTDLSIGGNNNELRFYEGSNYVGFEAPALTGDQIWVLPAADGSNGQVLQTNGSGTLSFATVSGGASDLNGLSDCKTFGTNSLMIGDASTGTIDAADNNTGVGVDIFAALTTGDRNTTMGTGSMAALTTGANNVGYGAYNLASITASNGNTAIGYQTQQNGDGGEYNVSVGYRAGREITSGDNNVSVGSYALDANTTGHSNVAIGHQALTEATTKNYNTAVGFQALTAEATSGSNTAVGGLAMMTSNGASNCTAIGKQAAYLLTTGDYNTFVGSNTGYNTTSSVENTALGYVALYANTTGQENVAIGSKANYNGTTASNNAIVGFRALYTATTGYSNSVLGADAMYSCTEGHRNVAIGLNAGYNITTGDRNICIGINARTAGNTDYRSILISTYEGYTKGSGTFHISAGTGSGNGYQGNNSSAWATTSDRRIKKNIVDNTDGLDKIKQIQVKNFEYRTKDEITDWTGEDKETVVVEKEGTQLGVIAQEIQEILPDVVNERDNGCLSVDSDNITWYLVNAVKQQQTIIDDLKSRLEELEK